MTRTSLVLSLDRLWVSEIDPLLYSCYDDASRGLKFSCEDLNNNIIKQSLIGYQVEYGTVSCFSVAVRLNK